MPLGIAQSNLQATAPESCCQRDTTAFKSSTQSKTQSTVSSLPSKSKSKVRRHQTLPRVDNHWEISHTHQNIKRPSPVIFDFTGYRGQGLAEDTWVQSNSYAASFQGVDLLHPIFDTVTQIVQRAGRDCFVHRMQIMLQLIYTCWHCTARSQPSSVLDTQLGNTPHKQYALAR